MSLKDNETAKPAPLLNDQTGLNNQDDEEDLLDAEELSRKKKLVDNVKHDNPSPLSNAMVGSLSQESLNQEDSNDFVENDILKKFNSESEKKTSQQLDDKKRQVKSSNSKYSNSDIITEFVNIRSIKSPLNNKVMYPISADKFAQFESKLFDLIGLTGGNFKMDDTQNKKGINLDKTEVLNANFIPNMEVLSNKLEINSVNQIQLKKMNNRTSFNASRSDTDNGSLADDERTQNLYLKAKLVTLMLNESVRPRRACRVLLTKRNTSSLDNIINEIENIFKVDNIKKIFNLSGMQINDPIDMYYQDDIFMAVSNEKIHTKDFELDPEEIRLLYINEFMTTYSKLNPAKVLEKNALRTNVNRKKSKQTDNLIVDSKDLIEFMPQELLENYEIGQIIGEGNYSIVRECRDINTGIQFALKIVDLKRVSGKEATIENEVNILRTAKHPNIVKLVEDYKSDDFYYLVFEFYKAGDLLGTITKRKKFQEKDAASIIYSLAATLAHIHSLEIVHRDVKLDNIMVQQYSDGSKSLKLGDFGSATYVDGPLTEKCGSPVYVAPEILLEKEYRYEVDVWSLGVIAYILMCGYAPFEGQNDDETFELIKTKELNFVEEDWLHISPAAVDLIKKMLDRNQETRIKASDILIHPWFIKEEESKITEKSSEIDKNNVNSETSVHVTEKSEENTLELDKSKSKSNDSQLVLTQIRRSLNNYKSTNIQNNLEPKSNESKPKNKKIK
ncbi:unnamed protein product [Brachionus calyciflorus]|uniref:non-specific serine/threonine protein kinase n=1 Tax=Brachionus calyciflorus TaxID=104777 RepID=A0A813PKH2_9BILA|nr:unnamed protein product [Brachionus calyciflorus]